MKTTFNTIQKQAAMLLMLLLAVTQGAWADYYITDVMLVGGTKREVDFKIISYETQGWTVVQQDLNQGCGSSSDYIYLLYKDAEDDDPGFRFITDFLISTEYPASDQIEYEGRTYHLATYAGGEHFVELKGDLNSNTNGSHIYLYYTKEPDNEYHTVKSISFNNTQAGGVAAPDDHTGYDFNTGCGSGSAHIYMHVEKTQGWIFWQGNATQCMITGFDGPKTAITSITIPVTLNNLKVIAINMAFSDFINLETMIFAKGTVLEQMPSAQGCKKLKKVISYDAFGSTNTNLPPTIKTIPGYAFAATAIQDLGLKGVTSVGEGAFEGCNNLQNILIPHTASIGHRAFANINSVAKVVYEGPLSNWDPNTFQYSPNLHIENCDSDWFCGWCGGKDESDHNRLYWKLEKKQTVNNLSYGHLTIDYDEVGVAYPDSQLIKSNTWRLLNQSRMRIKIITFNHVYALGANGFRNYYYLETVNLDSVLKSIGASAFSGCSKLTDIYYDGTQAQWDAMTKGNGWKPDTTKVHWHCTVTFNANGHGAAPASQSIRWSNEDKAAEPNAPTASGYVFTGWYTDARCTTPWDFSTAVPGDMTLHAGWMEQKLALNDGSTNDLTSYNGQKYTVTLLGRTLYLDGDWNTLCLPFSLNNLKGTPLEGFTIKTLDTATESGGHKSGYNSGTLYLNFKDATSITAGKPYILRYVSDVVISSEAEWNTFAQNVSNGTSYEGKVVRLDADINVSTMANGTFKGTLDGNGHTINLNLRGGGQGLALFYVIDGATIKNVRVTGTVTSSYHRPATFAAFVDGSSTIKNCWSSVAIVSTHNNAWIDGGAFVSRVASGVTLTMTDCAFTGSVTYNAQTYSGGSMVGFTQSGATANLTNCMYFPTALALTAVAYNPHIFVSGDERGNLTNCYYNAVAKASILENEGFYGSGMSTAALAAALGTNWEVGGDYAIPKWTFKDPVFKTVTINAAAPTAVTTGDGNVSFKGSYNPVGIGNEASNTILFLAEDNTLRRPNAAMDINACRAWFQLASSRLGDVNGDKSINVTDVTLLVNHILGNQDENFIIANADVNSDESVTVTDVTSLVNLILNNSNIDIQNVVINGADGLTFSGGGSGPARAKNN